MVRSAIMNRLIASLTLAVAFMLHGIALADPVQSVQYYEDKEGVEVGSTAHGTDAHTPFAIASIGKTMTSVAVLRLAEEGVIDIDGLAADWVPHQVKAGLGGLRHETIRDLLTMTSGLPDYLTDTYIDDALADPDRIQNPLTALSYAYGEKRVFETGTAFDYSNTNYVLLGIILEAATGKSYAAIIQDEVFTPAGMGSSFVFGSTPLPDDFPNGHEDGYHYRAYYQAQGFGDGGVISTASDLARFYKALFVTRDLLSADSMRDFLYDPIGEDYGMGIDIADGLLGHSGGDLGFVSDVRFDPRTQAIAIFLSADAEADTAWTYDRLLDWD